MNRIFINIASYRDKELIPTVKDALQKAKDKSRISFGICWQHDDEEPLNFGEDSDPLFKGIKINYSRYNYLDSKGMGWARKISQSFWREEEYQLQIDSHMRFTEGWDWHLLNLMARVKSKYKSKKIILTSRTLPYYPEKGGELKKGLGTYMHSSKFRDNGVLTLTSGGIRGSQNIKDPIPGAFISGHYMFSSSKILQEMPYDDHFAVISTGDEPILSIKSWTRGWDIFYPHKVVIWHHFYREQSSKNHNDHKKIVNQLSDGGVTQFNNIISGKVTDARYALGKERTLEDYKTYCGVDYKNKTVDTNLVFVNGVFSKTNNKEQQVKPIEIFNISTSSSSENKIYVQIASYRDPDVVNTISDLLEKAERPGNIIVGICDQYGPENKHLLYYDNPAFRVSRIPFYASPGLGWARNMIQKLYFKGDAQYTMQLDSHMRFGHFWDTKLKEMLHKTGSKKPILSHYCTPFNLSQKNSEYLSREDLFKMYCLRFNPTGTVSFRQTSVKKEEKNGKPIPSMLVSGHFYFTLASHIHEYKYDPFLYFAGDEISLATRSWTRGWDIFTPSENLVFHNYTREERVCHWSDQKNSYSQLHEESLKKLRQMLHGEDNKFEIGEYGLGTERNLQEFERISGIDFKNRELKEHAKQGVALF